jgi:hypothetical protein
MKEAFEILKTTRRNQLAAIKDLTLEQLNVIPQGFNNNLIWNLGHVIVTQQLLCYKLSGNPLNVEADLLDKFAKGTLPSPNFEFTDLERLKKYAKSLPDLLESDYNSGLFKTYNKYPTSYGYELNSIEDAINFNNVHEGVHLGYIMSLKRAVLSLT